MGRAPPHIIFKRLATHMVKNMIPEGLIDLEQAQQFEEKFRSEEGMPETPEYKMWAERVKELNFLQQRYSNLIKSRGYLNHVLKHIGNPPRRVNIKGRFKFHYHHPPYERFKLTGISLNDLDNKYF